MVQDEPRINLSYATGERTLAPVKYYVVERTSPPRWLRPWTKRVWWIETEYCRFGPFTTFAAAYRVLLAGGVRAEPGIRSEAESLYPGSPAL